MSEQCQPIFASDRSTVKPGVPRSTTSSERPAWPGPPVRTAVVTKSARTPEVMKVLAPLTTKWSPSRRAVVRMPATSDPPSGSVTASEPTSSPASVGRTNRSTRSGLPEAARCGSAMPEVNSAAISPDAAPAPNMPSWRSTVSSSVPPSPPTSVGNPTPSSPCFAAAACSSRGMLPASSHSCRWGTTSRRVNSAPTSRIPIRRGPPGC